MQELAAKITCYEDQSCAELRVTAYEHIRLSLELYRHSENVKVVHANYHTDKVSVQCGNPDDRLFLRYDLDDFPSDKQLLTLGRIEYDLNPMPCEDGHVDCTSIADLPQSCQYEYAVSPSVVLDAYQFADTGAVCLWFELPSVFNPVCRGECNGEDLLFHHTQVFNLSLNFSEQNETTNFELLCDEFFRTDNVTEHTLEKIEQIIGSL